MRQFSIWFLEHWVVLFIGWVMCFFVMLMIVKMATEVPENHPDFNKDFSSDFYAGNDHDPAECNITWSELLLTPFKNLWLWVKNLF